MIRDLVPQLRQSTRSMLRNPGFALTATLILGTGLGLTSYMFAAVNGYLLRPLPFPGSERLIHVELARPSERMNSIDVGLHDFLALREGQSSLESLAAFSMGTINLSDSQRPERFEGAFVSANAFEALGVRPALGRGFVAGDDAPGAPAVVVLGHTLWRDRYGADAGVVGRTVRLNGRTAIVVGVMPEGFRFPIGQDVWTALELDPARAPRGRELRLEVFGKLRPGVGLDQARAELGARLAELAREFPDTNAGLAPVVKPFADEFLGSETRRDISAMLATVMLVLLIACANVANLMLARTEQRRRELAVRSALGASRTRLLLEVLGECALVSLAGGALGHALATAAAEWTMQALRASESLTPPYWVDLAPDWRTTAFSVSVSLLAAVVAGLVPAMRATRVDILDGLRAGGHGLAGNPLGRLTRGFLAAQLAFACVVLVGAGLMARSVMAVHDVEVGADVARTLTGRIGLAETDYPRPADRARFFERLEERLRSLPGVTAATLATSLPATRVGYSPLGIEGQTPEKGARRPYAAQLAVASSYFSTFGIGLVEGRAFGLEDGGVPTVAIVNRKLAARYWPGQSAIGRRLRLETPGGEGPWLSVVGVVPDVVQNPVDEPLEPTVYLPLGQSGARFASLAVRTSGDPMALAEGVRGALRELDPDTPIYWVRTLEAWLEQGRFQSRFFALLFGSFAAGGLLLGALGQYAVLAYAVAQRSREIGLRRALGAADRQLLRMTLADGMRHLAWGLGVGLLLSLGFARLLSGMLVGVSPADVPTLAAVAVGLTLSVVLASLLPARRALRIDPAVALRCD
jgi:putative ABC transport system permease protein